MVGIEIEESLMLLLRITDKSDSCCDKGQNIKNKQLIREHFELFKKESCESKESCVERTKNKRYEKRIKKKKITQEEKWYKKWIKTLFRLMGDMRIAGSCRQSVTVPVFLWTSVVLLSLTCTVHCTSEELIRNERSTSPEIQGYMPPDVQDPYTVLNFFREMQTLLEQKMLQKQQQQQINQQLQTYNNGEGLSEGGIDFEKLPIPLAFQSRTAYIDDGSKEDSKRGSYMSLCHFKICNMGKRKSMRWIQRYRK